MMTLHTSVSDPNGLQEVARTSNADKGLLISKAKTKTNEGITRKCLTQ